MGEVKYNIILVKEDELSHIFLIKEALDRNEYVCFQGDRFVNKENVITANFLGAMADFPAGPFQIASRFKVPVVIYLSEKESANKYSFRFFFPEPAKRTSSMKPENILLSQYVKILEERVKVHPEQWFNFYKFWK